MIFNQRVMDGEEKKYDFDKTKVRVIFMTVICIV